MPILKGKDAAHAAQGAIVLDLGDLRRQANQIIEQAHAQAKRITAQAQADMARSASQAHDQSSAQGRAAGLAQGLEEGRAQGRAEALEQMRLRLETIEQAWIAAAQQLDAQHDEMLRQARRNVLELAVSMGEKIVHRVIEVDPTVIVDQLDRVLAFVLRPADVAVRIHPDDVPVVHQAMPQLQKQYANLQHVELIEDDNVATGGCVVTFGQGRIDASIDTQLSRIVHALLPAGTAVATIEAEAPTDRPLQTDSSQPLNASGETDEPPATDEPPRQTP